MKSIKIDLSTYCFLLLLFLSGMIKNGILIFIIIFIHEIGHVVIAKLSSYEVIKITLYPFGGITKLNKDLNSPFLNDFCLAIGGIFAQVLLYIFFLNLFKNSYINKSTFDAFVFYNNTIMLFNLLPIIPLDGSNIIELILQKFFSFKKSYNLNILVSTICLLIFIYFNHKFLINNYMIIFFLIYKVIENFKNRRYILKKFFLERMLKKYNFSYIKKEENCNLNNLKKYTYFYFWDNRKWIDEKTLLKKTFK